MSPSAVTLNFSVSGQSVLTPMTGSTRLARTCSAASVLRPWPRMNASCGRLPIGGRSAVTCMVEFGLPRGHGSPRSKLSRRWQCWRSRFSTRPLVRLWAFVRAAGGARSGTCGGAERPRSRSGQRDEPQRVCCRAVLSRGAAEARAPSAAPCLSSRTIRRRWPARLARCVCARLGRRHPPDQAGHAAEHDRLRLVLHDPGLRRLPPR